MGFWLGIIGGDGLKPSLKRRAKIAALDALKAAAVSIFLLGLVSFLDRVP